jgi:hypothetical protein
MGERMDLNLGEQRLKRGHVDAGGGEQGVRERRLAQRLLGVGTRVLEHTAYQRIAIGVRSARRQADQDVTRADGAAVDDARFLYDADTKTGQIVIGFGIHAGHFSRLAADERCAGLAAAFCNPGDNPPRRIHLELPGGVVVQKKQRLGTQHGDVIDAHGNQIDADRVVTPHLDRQLELGAYPVGARDQHRLAIAVDRQLEQPPKAAEAAEHTDTAGALNQRFDGLDELIAGIDVHTRAAVGHVGRVLVGGLRHTDELSLVKSLGASSWVRALMLSYPAALWSDDQAPPMEPSRVTAPVARFVHLLICCVLPLVLGLSFDLHAAVVRGLYSAEVPIQDQSEAARSRGFEQALREVFVKVSGDSRVRSDPELDAILRRAPRYVREFSYTTHAPLDSSGGTPSLWLRVSFDGTSVDRLLRESGLPVWGKERPSTLLWLAVQGGRERSIVGSDSNASLLESITKAAEVRGVPVLLPLMDLEDRSRVNFADFLGGFDENVLAASERYGADATLIASLSRRNSGSWHGRFTLRSVGLQESRELNAGSADALIRSGIDFMADQLASQYAYSSQEARETTVVLQVTGVDALTDYARVLAYLNGLSPVSSVEPRSLAPGSVGYTMTVRGGRADLQRVIALGSVLDREPLPPLDTQTMYEEGAAALHYRLRR